MTTAKFSCPNEAETARVAAQIADTAQSSTIILLQGDLGAGKTAFSRAFIRHLTQNPVLDVPSPTFTLVQTYESPKAKIYHFDLYRLKDQEEIFEIGWEEALADGIVLVEWPERLGNYRSKRAWTLTLSPLSGHADGRTLTLEMPE